jgi:hypothetical protein
VPQDVEPVGRVLGHDLEVSAAIYRGVEVYQLAIQLRDHGIAGEARPDLLGHVARLLAGLNRQLPTVW